MKTIIIAARRIWADKYLAGVVATFIVISIIVMILLSVHIQPSDLQVTTRFSSLGLQHIYKDSWYFQWSFALFISVVLLSHLAIIGKLALLKRRRPAIAVGFFSIAVAFVALLMLSSVFSWNL